MAKKYNVIYADPAWDVKMFKRKTRPNQQAHAYPMMKLEDIKQLEVDSISKDNCVLFLWTTHAYLPKAFEVMEAWGFSYQRTITWDKMNGLCLYGFHHRTEFILVGRKGNLPKFPKRKTIPTLIQISSKKLRHSEKPKEIREMIEVFGNDRIELFARVKTEGWDVWGNEVVSDINFNGLAQTEAGGAFLKISTSNEQSNGTMPQALNLPPVSKCKGIEREAAVCPVCWQPLEDGIVKNMCVNDKCPLNGGQTDC